MSIITERIQAVLDRAGLMDRQISRVDCTPFSTRIEYVEWDNERDRPKVERRLMRRKYAVRSVTIPEVVRYR